MDPGGTGAPVGENDVRLTDVGPAENVGYDASYPRAAYDSVNDVYLIIWFGDDDSSGSVNDEFEIFAQWLSTELQPTTDNHIRVSSMGPPEDIAFAAERPKLAMNSRSGGAFLVWHGDSDVGALVDDEFEIYASYLGLSFEPIRLPIITVSGN